MKIAILILILIASYFHTQETSKDEVKLTDRKTEFNEDFHEDFDSTYFWNGCKTNTFKLNHKCNANN